MEAAVEDIPPAPPHSTGQFKIQWPSIGPSCRDGTPSSCRVGRVKFAQAMTCEHMYIYMCVCVCVVPRTSIDSFFFESRQSENGII